MIIIKMQNRIRLLILSAFTAATVALCAPVCYAADISLSKPVVTEYTVTISGTVASSAGTPVMIQILKPGFTFDDLTGKTPQQMWPILNTFETVYSTAIQGNSGSNFEKTITMSATASEGDYNVKAASFWSGSYVTAVFTYKNPATIISRINNCTYDEIEQIITDYKDYLMPDVKALYDNSLSDGGKALVKQALLDNRGAGYTALAQIKSVLSEAIAVAYFNDALQKDADSVGIAINNPLINTILSLKVDGLFGKIKYKDVIYNKIFDERDKDVYYKTDINAAFDAKVIEQRLLELSLIHPIINVSSASGNLGQQITLGMGFQAPVSFGTTELYISYDSNVFNMPSASDIILSSGVTASPDYQSCNTDLAQSGIIHLTITAKDQKDMTVQSDICTLKFNIKANAPTGNAPVTVNGRLGYNDLGTWRYVSLPSNPGAVGYITVSSRQSQENSGSNSGGGGGYVYVPPVIATPTPQPAKATPEVKKGFADMTNALWAEESVNALVKKGALSGVGEGKFNPNGNVTREQFIKMLISAFDLTDDMAQSNFYDVPTDSWSYKYVATAQKLGISMGMGDGTFGAQKEVTRQEMAAMAYRTAVYTSVFLIPINQPEVFSDQDQIGSYAAESIEKLQTAGIINGIGNNRFGPNDSATRAMAAKIIYQILKAGGRL